MSVRPERTLLMVGPSCLFPPSGVVRPVPRWLVGWLVGRWGGSWAGWTPLVTCGCSPGRVQMPAVFGTRPLRWLCWPAVQPFRLISPCPLSTLMPANEWRTVQLRESAWWRQRSSLDACWAIWVLF